MRYNEFTTYKFKTKHWLSLLKSNIGSLADVRDRSQSCAFVAIDSKPYYDKQRRPCVAEIGVAVISPQRYEQDIAGSESRISQSLQSFVDQYSVQSYSFRVRESGDGGKHREPYQFGQTCEVAAEQVDSELANLFVALKTQFQDIVLVGYDLSFEIHSLIASDQHGITQHISSWVDIQELVGDLDVDRDQTKITQPSRRHAQLALGVDVCGTGGSRFRSEHIDAYASGNDAVRVLAILESLLRLPDNEVLHIGGMPMRKDMAGGASPTLGC